jgi:CheY-like chemotaxis protein
VRVLVVDSDRDIREVVQDLLSGPHSEPELDVRTVGDPEAAVRALTGVEAGEFDALLCHLPALRAKGGRLARQARALGPKLRVVAMSANGRRATEGEADANLAKPFSRAKLLAALLSR